MVIPELGGLLFQGEKSRKNKNREELGGCGLGFSLLRQVTLKISFFDK